MKLTNQ